MSMRRWLHSLKRDLPFSISLLLVLLIGLQAQDPAGKDRKTDDEYIEIRTPFGIQKVRKEPGAKPSEQNEQAPPVRPNDQPPPAQAPVTTTPPAADRQTEPEATQAAPQEQPGQTEATSTSQSPAQLSSRTSGSIRLRLDRADLHQVINIIGNELKLNYVVDPRVKGTVTINTAGEFRRAGLLALLETILRINGASIVKTGNFYQIVPANVGKTLPIPIRTQSTEEMKDENALVMQVVSMQVVLASDMEKILGSFLSEEGNMVVHTTGNILIITERGSNLKRLLELVNIFDSEVFQSQRVQLYPIKNNSSKNLLPDLESVFAGYALSERGSAIRFISIDRINSILAISPNPKSFLEVEKWIEKLDRPVENVGMRNYFYKIENGEARNIATLLLQIYSHQQPPTEEAAPLVPAPGAAPGLPEAGRPQPERMPVPLLQSEINVVADEINNAVIIRCTPQDYEIIKETIKELDLVPRQVLIDAKIYEVTLTGALSMGVAAFLQSRSRPIVPAPPGTTASFSASSVGSLLPGLNVSTFTVIGQSRELVAFLNAQESRSRTKVLSSPSIIASDNKNARIQVGAEVPILTSQGLVPGGQIGGTSLFTNTVQNRSTGVILTVTPRINSSGWVTLKIQQEVSAPVAPQAGAGIQSPSISIRSVDTQVTVKDGETIAIGGIISENKGLTKNRVPLLGDIPGLGLLFGNTSYSNARTELIALITPHVIQDIEAAADITEELKTQLKTMKKDLRKIEQSMHP